MASTVASKRAVPLVRALEKLLAASSAPGAGSALRPVAVGGGLRGYNTGAQLRRYEGNESEDDSVREYENRRGGQDYAVPSLFSDIFRDSFSAPQSLGRLLSLMDDFAVAAPGRAGAVRRGWNAKEDEEALHLRVDMPGLGKEHVKVWAEPVADLGFYHRGMPWPTWHTLWVRPWAEQNSLVIKGEGEKESGEGDDVPPPRYGGRIELASEVYRMDKIKAEMKNGVLKVVVPKVKEEQRKDVFQVNVE